MTDMLHCSAGRPDPKGLKQFVPHRWTISLSIPLTPSPSLLSSPSSEEGKEKREGNLRLCRDAVAI
jgi:hypothetical protein